MLSYFWRTIYGTAIIFVGLTTHSLGLAQSITAIDETGTIANHKDNIYRIQGGTRSQGNLFHSFQQFGLKHDEIADFISAPEIQNILGRVTGGDPSIVNGTIQVTGGNSNLYLMNPAGIIFGSNASLNVPGAFVATTSDRIGFSEGWFNAAGENNYQDLVGYPDRFAFLSENPSAIINQGNLAVQTGNNVTLIGGTIINTGTISALGGDITLAAVPGTRLVRISQGGMLLSVELPAEDVAAGITPLELPELLTTPEGKDAIADLPIPQRGDVFISSQIQGETVNLMAANQVDVVKTENPLVLTGDGTNSAPTVTIFPENTDDPLAYVFLDSLVENYEDFLYNGKPGTVSMVVTPDRNGIEIISDRLSQISETAQKVDEIHILSEGNKGNFWLGNAYVSGETIEQYRDEFRSWRSALSPEADILLYSCLTALGETGQSLMQTMAIETGADIAASTNLTGNSALGGDWVFEKQIGNIEANLAFENFILEEYKNTLAVLTASNITELNNAIAIANANGVSDTINLTTNTLFSLGSSLPNLQETLTINGFGSILERDVSQGNFRLITVSNNATLTLNNLQLRNGYAQGGSILPKRGGAILVSDGNLNVNNSTFTNNYAPTRGGAIHIINGTATINNSTFTQNTTNNLGGGISGGVNSIITLNNSTISGNTANNLGGGISGAANSIITLNNSTISGNISETNSGGGISLSGGTLTINSSIISGNSAPSFGGGIDSYNSSTLGQITINTSTISGNIVGKSGGGISSIQESTLSITNSTISGNIATNNGGGINNSQSVMTLQNSTVSGNSAGNQGGGISNNGNNTNVSKIDIYNSTIYGNSSTNYGAGIVNNDSGGGNNAIANLRNTIIAGNISTNQPSQRDVSNNSALSDLGNNLIGVDDPREFNNSSTLFGTSNNPLDPVLSPLGNYTGDTETHIPLPGSPAINRGSTTGTLSTDQRGLNRGTLVDIGSVEVTADLQISQIVSTATPEINTDIGVVLAVENLGPDPVGGVFVTSLLPSGFTLNTVTPSYGSITVENNIGLWTLGNIDGSFDLINEENLATLTLVGQVSNPDIFDLAFLSFIQSDTFQGEDPDLSNNVVQASSTIINTNLLSEIGFSNFQLSLQPKSSLKVRQPLLSSISSLSDEAVFSEIEETFSQEYKKHLEIEEEHPITLHEAQNLLHDIEETNGIVPAVIYAYFKPQNSGLEENELWRFSPRENQQTNAKPLSSPNDELHLLVITPSDRPIRRHFPEVTREKALSVAQNFRRTITSPRRPNAYLDPARQMYRWLVGSIAKELEEREVDSLSFILDGGLRTLPLAALHDGENFIIDRYSIGMMPSFFLTAPEYREIKGRTILAMGADRFTNLEDLPAVPTELELVGNKLWQGEFYLNENFTTNNLKQARSQSSFGLVHLATHGEFKPGKADNSYIQFWDEKLPLTRFRELGLNDPQIELLVLSACRTAVGDLDAELGFAGLAIATGVKTAIGSLWYVSDEATLALMTGFYSQLDNAAIKVEALRQAQLSLLHGETRFEEGKLIFPEGNFALPPELSSRGDRLFNHPYYWSAFTTIGSPW